MWFRSSVWILLLAIAGLAQEESEIEVESKPEAEPEKAKEPEKPKPLGPAAARVAGQTIEWVDAHDRAKFFSFKLPADWNHKERRAVRNDFTLDLYLPGLKDLCALSVTDYVWETCPRGGPEWTRRSRQDDKNLRGSEIRSDPLPHILCRYTWHKKEWTRLIAYRRSRGHTLELLLDLPSDQVAIAYRDFLTVAQSLSTSKQEWPEIPKSYKILKAGPFRVAIHPGVKQSTKHILRTIKLTQKICDRMHGRLPAPGKGESVPVIYIHAHRPDAYGLLPRLAGGSGLSDICESGMAMFVFAYPPENKTGNEFLSADIGKFNAYWRWGGEVPQWVHVGEARVVRAEFDGKQKLPRMSTGYFEWGDGVSLGSLGDLMRKDADKNWSEFTVQSMFYVAFFHAGPSKYRKAYRNFLAEASATADPRGAFEAHLRVLDLDELEEAANKFRSRKIVVVDD